MEPRDREIRLDGLRFHFLEWGEANGPPLVLLHGFTSHARTWDHFAEAMADRFRVLALDQRGHGDSDRARDGDYRVAAMPDGRLVEIPEAGHTVPGDQPEAFTQAVSTFLGE